MYFSFLVSKRLALAPILVAVAIQFLLLHSVSSLNMTNAFLHHKCYVSQGKYKQGSQYEKELTTIIDSIKTSNFSSGYENEAFEDGPTYVSVTHQCRGDSYGPKCRSCYATALSGLRKRCPKYKGGIIWYDQCLLEISGKDSSRKIDYENNFCMSNAKNTSSDQYAQFLFYNEWNILIDNLTTIATTKKINDPTVYYAAGERRLKTKKLYGMVQCAKDISRKACGDCMVRNLVHFQDCLKGSQGGRVLGKSCTFRFELYPFVNTKSETKNLKI